MKYSDYKLQHIITASDLSELLDVTVDDAHIALHIMEHIESYPIGIPAIRGGTATQKRDWQSHKVNYAHINWNLDKISLIISAEWAEGYIEGVGGFLFTYFLHKEKKIRDQEGALNVIDTKNIDMVKVKRIFNFGTHFYVGTLQDFIDVSSELPIQELPYPLGNITHFPIYTTIPEVEFIL